MRLGLEGKTVVITGGAGNRKRGCKGIPEGRGSCSCLCENERKGG